MILKPKLFRKPRKGHWATKGLVFFPLMNEGSGNKVFDLSGNGNVGTFQGTAPSWTSGKFGSAVLLPGTNEYISLPNDKFQFPGDFTIVIHTKVGSIGQYDTLISQCNTNGRGWRLWTRDSSSFKYYFECDAGNNTISTSLIGGEQQIICVKDSVNLSIYINGVLEGTPQAIGTISYAATQVAQIGGMVTAGRWWPGRIDYCYLYNRALSAGEIAELYREPFGMLERDSIELWVGATSVGVPPTGIAAYTHHYQQQL